MATKRKDHYEHSHRKNQDKSRRAAAVGRRIKARREEMGIGISELARRCGWDVSRIWKYETGHALPGHEAMDCLSKELGISLQELFALATGTGPDADADDGDEEPADSSASGAHAISVPGAAPPAGSAS